MVDMGAEVGQKMRSAIKAKLTELECYVDDELPDYIMVMVANKRTKTQMNEDLSLFLKKKTSTFVDWLHLVLKKLKEVTVTNLDVYKKASKRKTSEVDERINQKKIKKESPKHSDNSIVKKETKYAADKSLTDDLPLNVNTKSLSENRKIVLISNVSADNCDENFSIPSFPTDQPSLKQLEDIESQIRNVKGRLGLKIDEDVEESELRRLVEESRKKPKVDKVDTPRSTLETKTQSVENEHPIDVRREHSKIIFSKEDFKSPSKSPPGKRSVLERLGKYGAKSSKSVLSRLGSYSADSSHGNSKKSLKSQDSREKDRKSKGRNEEIKKETGGDLRKQLSSGQANDIKKGIKKRLGLSSKVTIPQINPQLLEDTFKKREVVSVVKVKPRVLPPNVQQANKNLLLKAVADAQKSIAQSKSVGKAQKFDRADLDLKYSEKNGEAFHKMKQRKISQEGKEILQQFLSSQSDESSDQEYVPTPLKNSTSKVEYVPSSCDRETEENKDNTNKKQKFIVTLDGIQKSEMVVRLSAKDRLQGRKTPSPIIFDAGKTKIERKIPDELPIVPITVPKKKEKCKYFPLCKNGEKCEFLHPVVNCEQFPYCKFGDKCLYIHPKCKFGTSCTKRDCPYVHANSFGARSATAVIPVKPQITKVQVCKFFPQCMNINCLFYHPKPCKYGYNCKNQSACTYMHANFPSRKNLTWRSK